MADHYFLDRPAASGYRNYKPTRISNNFHLENIAVSGNTHGGLLQTPPRFLSVPSIHIHQFYPFIQQPPPPLLPPPPPPILRPHRSLPSQPRSHSLKKSKPTKRGKDSPPAVDRRIPSRTFSSAAAKRVVRVEELDKLSGCLFAVISPPPSSLPLPKFSLRPVKLNCNVEAAGADDGAAAADDLRRLLRLR